jgi:hypothetical protein
VGKCRTTDSRRLRLEPEAGYKDVHLMSTFEFAIVRGMRVRHSSSLRDTDFGINSSVIKPLSL